MRVLLRRRKTCSSPPRTSCSSVSGTSGPLRSHTPSRRTNGPFEQKRVNSKLNVHVYIYIDYNKKLIF